MWASVGKIKLNHYFIQRMQQSGSLMHFLSMTPQWPQTTLLCFCLWSDEGRGQGGMEREREYSTTKSVVREIPLRLQRAMTCLITFMFDWVQCSLKLAWRKWDFPSQNITLHPSSKPSIKVLYILPLCQFYRSHQAPSALPSFPSHTSHWSDQNKPPRRNNDSVPWESMKSLKQAHAVIPNLHMFCRTNAAL